MHDERNPVAVAIEMLQEHKGDHNMAEREAWKIHYAKPHTNEGHRKYWAAVAVAIVRDYIHVQDTLKSELRAAQ